MTARILLLPVLLSALALSSCSTGQNKERLLSAAGFRTVVPSTPQQVAKLKTMPQRQVIPVTKNGKTSFLFADSARNLLLIGNQNQYSQFQQYALQYHLAEDKVEAASLNADAADWGCWGGGFWGPGFY
jgi:hypothetical protein